MPVEPPIQPTIPPDEAPAAPQPGQPETPQPEYAPPAPDIDVPAPNPGGDPAGAPIQPTA